MIKKLHSRAVPPALFVALLALPGILAAQGAAPTVVSVSPSSGVALSQTFTAVYGDTNGAANLNAVYILFNTSVSAAKACYVEYSPIYNLLYLKNDAGTGSAGSVTPGSATQVQNSQCTLSGTGSSFSPSGTTGTLLLNLTFSANFYGNIYLYGSDRNGLTSGWVKEGTWGQPSPPSVTGVSPSYGAGYTQTFTATYSDPNGAAAVDAVYLLFNTSVSAANACFVEYYPSSNLLSLKANNGTASAGSVTPGSESQAANSQCTLSGFGASYSASGNTASLTVALTFSSTAPANIYLWASDANGTNSGWVKEGVWGETSAAPTAVSVSPSTGSALSQAFTAIFTDANGAPFINAASLLFNTSPSAVAGCQVTYNPSTNALALNTDDGTGTVGSVTPGSEAQVTNSQCELSGFGSSYSVSGTTAMLTVVLTFHGSSPEAIYLYASDENGASTGWVQKGEWGAESSAAPSVTSVTPNAGSGATQTFTAVYMDSNGGFNVNAAYLLFNKSLSAVNGCYVEYNPTTNLLSLKTDAGTALAGSVTPGAAGTISNSTCTVAGTGSSYAAAGTTATLTVAITFSGTTTENIYLWASDRNKTNSGWAKEGTWTP